MRAPPEVIEARGPRHAEQGAPGGDRGGRGSGPTPGKAFGAAERVAGDVHWAALPACLPTWLVMLLIVNLDNMLTLAAQVTERLKVLMDGEDAPDRLGVTFGIRVNGSAAVALARKPDDAQFRITAEWTSDRD